MWGRCLWRVSAGNHRSQAHDIMSRITSTTITVVSFYKRMRESSNCSEYSVYGKKKMNKSYQDVKKHISLNTTKQRQECSIAHTQYTCAIKYMHRIQRGLCCTTHTCCRDKNKKKMAVWIYCLFCQITVIIDFAGGHQIIRYRHYSLLQFDLRGQAVRDELDRFIVIQPLHFVQLRPPTFIIQLGSVRQSSWPSVWLPGCETEQDKSGSKWWQRKISMKNKEKFMLFMSMDGRNQSTKTERSEAACKT